MTKFFNRSMHYIKLNGFQFRDVCFSSCHERGTKEGHEESNLKPSDSALRCSTIKPQRLYGERDLLRSSCEFGLVSMIVRSLTFICISLYYWLNRATSRNLPSQSPCGTDASLTCQRRCPYIAQACYIILGGSTYFAFQQLFYVTQIWTNGDSLNFFPF